MSTDPHLPKDPVAAAEILADLEEKDKDETVCRYPTCRALRQVTTGTGRPSVYCYQHTAVSNHRARANLKAIVAGETRRGILQRENIQPRGVASVESVRHSILSGILQLQNSLERSLTILAEIADPEVSAAQIQATLDRAEARIAQAQQSVSTERSLRLAADAALMVAQEDARAEREAAEQAIGQMEEAQAHIQRLMEETEQHIADVQTERDDTVSHVRIEAQRTIEAIESQAREAEARAYNAEVQARTQSATAERLVREGQLALDRERAEVDRLRSELTETIMQARTRAEADRTEVHGALQRERVEVDWLRGELAVVRVQAEQATARADQLALRMDELRTQLVQIQLLEREKMHQEKSDHSGCV